MSITGDTVMVTIAQPPHRTWRHSIRNRIAFVIIGIMRIDGIALALIAARAMYPPRGSWNNKPSRQFSNAIPPGLSVVLVRSLLHGTTPNVGIDRYCIPWAMVFPLTSLPGHRYCRRPLLSIFRNRVTQAIVD